MQWVYHPKFHGKITKVTINDKQLKSVRSSEFQYEDKNGQLVKARTSDGKGIVLIYDAKGRISQITKGRSKIRKHYAGMGKGS